MKRFKPLTFAQVALAFSLLALTPSLARAEIREIHSFKMGGDPALLDATGWILAGHPPAGWAEKTKAECAWSRHHPGDARELTDPRCALEQAFGSRTLAERALRFYQETGYAISVGQDADLDDSGGLPSQHESVRWSETQMNTVIEAIADLPSHFKKLKWMKCFFLSRELEPGMSMAYLQDRKRNIPAAVVFSADLSDPQYARSPKEVVVHEMGHIWTYHYGRKGWQELSRWEEQGLGLRGSGSNFVTEYSRQSPVEDFAESVAFYRYHPAELMRVSPAKYRYMKERVFKGIEYIKKN